MYWTFVIMLFYRSAIGWKSAFVPVLLYHDYIRYDGAKAC